MNTNSPLVKIFGRSPFKPIESHMAIVLKCAEELTAFFAAANQDDWQVAADVRKKLSQYEKDADRFKADIRAHLPSTLFMPVARTDLLELVTIQDKMANMAKDISGLMLGREQGIPEQVRPTFDQYLKIAIETIYQANETIRELDELLETGFRGQEVDLVGRMIKALDAKEHETDVLEITLRRELRQIETTLPPVDVFFLYQIIDHVGELANIAQRVGSRLTIMLAR
jgi:uncharacterized protein